MTDPRSRLAASDVERFRDLALTLAEESRRQLRELYAGRFEVKRKSDGSFVTSADLQVETRLRAMIEGAFPDHGILGEEGGARAGRSDYRWVVDPLDGTTN